MWRVVVQFMRVCMIARQLGRAELGSLINRALELHQREQAFIARTRGGKPDLRVVRLVEDRLHGS